MVSRMVWMPYLFRQINHHVLSRWRLKFAILPQCSRSRWRMSGRSVGILETVTRILLVPMYFGWSLKNFVMQPPASGAACSSFGSNTSNVAKLRLLKYWHMMPEVRRSSSNVPRQSPGFEVSDDQRYVPGLQSLGDFGDGQDDVA